MRSLETGYFASFSAARLERPSSSPPQLGHRPAITLSAQDRQKAHSNEQIRSYPDSGAGINVAALAAGTQLKHERTTQIPNSTEMHIVDSAAVP
jgi:hypothetical protein